eukprot:1308091-Pyramimonas_sp.AAC.1
MMTTASGQPIAAPMLITPTTMTAYVVLASVMKISERVRHARPAHAREWPTWYHLSRIMPPNTRANAF